MAMTEIAGRKRFLKPYFTLVPLFLFSYPEDQGLLTNMCSKTTVSFWCGEHVGALSRKAILWFGCMLLLRTSACREPRWGLLLVLAELASVSQPVVTAFKVSLALEICRDWASHEVYTEVKLV